MADTGLAAPPSARAGNSTTKTRAMAEFEKPTGAIRPVAARKPKRGVMGELAIAEYKALRETIRERGTVRAITFFVALCVWAALEAASTAQPRHAIAFLAPLVVLIAGFETVFQLHVGVERVGRYLQVAYEHTAGWETAAMAYGKAHPTSGSDPLFARIFLLVTLIGVLLPVALLARESLPAWLRVAYGGVIVAHLAFGIRVLLAKRQAARQRAEDLVRFRELLGKG